MDQAPRAPAEPAAVSVDTETRSQPPLPPPGESIALALDHSPGRLRLLTICLASLPLLSLALAAIQPVAALVCATFLALVAMPLVSRFERRRRFILDNPDASRLYITREGLSFPRIGKRRPGIVTLPWKDITRFEARGSIWQEGFSAKDLRAVTRQGLLPIPIPRGHSTESFRGWLKLYLERFTVSWEEYRVDGRGVIVGRDSRTRQYGLVQVQVDVGVAAWRRDNSETWAEDANQLADRIWFAGDAGVSRLLHEHRNLRAQDGFLALAASTGIGASDEQTKARIDDAVARLIAVAERFEAWAKRPLPARLLEGFRSPFGRAERHQLLTALLNLFPEAPEATEAAHFATTIDDPRLRLLALDRLGPSEFVAAVTRLLADVRIAPLHSGLLARLAALDRAAARTALNDLLAQEVDWLTPDLFEAAIGLHDPAEQPAFARRVLESSRSAPAVRRLAFRSFIFRLTAADEPWLMQLVANADPILVEAGVLGLRAVGSPLALPVLTARSEGDEFLGDAARARNAVVAIEQRMRAADDEVREVLQSGRADHLRPALSNIAASLEVRWRALDALLTQLPDTARAALPHELLGDASLSSRVLGARAAAMLSLSEAAGAIRQLLDEPVEAVKVEAMNALGELNAADSEPALLLQLKSRSEAIRLAALAALGKLGGPDSVPAIQYLSHGADSSDVRDAAREALESIRGRHAAGGLTLADGEGGLLSLTGESQAREATAKAAESS